VRGAGEAALRPESFVFNRFERWGVTRALRDYALRGGPRERIMKLLEERYDLARDSDWKIDVENFREAALLAHLMLEGNLRRKAIRELEQVIAWIDANAYMGPVYNLRTKAEALALLGRDEEALSLLAESFRKLDYTAWWYTLRIDPAWDRLRGDPRFVKIATDVRAYIALQERELHRLRRLGQLPDRARSPDSNSSAANPA
jgi:hypothetical protein